METNKELSAIFLDQRTRLTNFLIAQKLGWFGSSSDDQLKANIDYRQATKDILETEITEMFYILWRKFYASRFERY